MFSCIDVLADCVEQTRTTRAPARSAERTNSLVISQSQISIRTEWHLSACGVVVHSVAYNALWKYEENTSTFHEVLSFVFSASHSRLFDRTSFVVNINKQFLR